MKFKKFKGPKLTLDNRKEFRFQWQIPLRSENGSSFSI
jgi:hypothetical protein